jgi:hypothetical protein
MGEAKNKKKRFLAAHPHCCFCGGSEPTTTVDHVPPRTCFANRAAPEGFEFPACDKCQEATRLDELAFGMFVRITDPSPNNYRREETQRAVQGIRNNLPHLMPNAGLTRRDKRNALKAKGLAVSPGKTIADVPMVSVPATINENVERYARKLVAALYYREKSKPLGLDFEIYVAWTTATDKNSMTAFLEMANMSPFVTVGKRTNLQFGDRFGYRYSKADDNDLFMAVAQFGQGLVLAMLVADGESAKKMDEDGWVPVSEMFAHSAAKNEIDDHRGSPPSQGLSTPAPLPATSFTLRVTKQS